MIKVEWEYWPEPVGGTQDDPVCGKTLRENIASAIVFLDELKNKYDSRLRIVTFTTLAYKGN